MIPRSIQGILVAPDEGNCILVEGIINFYKLRIVQCSREDELIRQIPLGKTPALIIDKDLCFTEPLAIILYLFSKADPESELLGKDTSERAQIIQWSSFALSEWLPPASKVLTELMKVEKDEKILEEFEKAVNKVSDIIEARLSKTTYIIGESITLADLFITSMLCGEEFESFWYGEWRTKYPKLTHWFDEIKTHPIMPAWLNIDEEEEMTMNNYSISAARDLWVNRSSRELELEMKSLDISKNFNLEEWKYISTNNDTRQIALPWFWEHFDPKGWSLWRFDYKYNNELKFTFMSNNLLGGFCNRLKASKNYLFGTGVIYGEDFNNGIVGVFLLKGQNHEPLMKVAPEWESFSFTKLDIGKPEDKTFVEDIFAWDKPIIIDGEIKEIADGKVFE